MSIWRIVYLFLVTTISVMIAGCGSSTSSPSSQTASANFNVLAGSTNPGNRVDGTGTAATFAFLTSVAVDAGSNNVFVADEGYLRKITPAGVVTTLTLTDSISGVSIANPNISNIASDSVGNIYAVAGFQIEKITPAGVVSPLAGSSTPGNVDGFGSAASFGFIAGIALDGSGNIFVVDEDANKIRKITPTGVVNTFAGSGATGAVDGAGATASFNLGGASRNAIAVDSSGNVYVVEWPNGDVRKINPAGVVSTLAGGSGRFGGTDGPGTVASFANPDGITVDGSGNVYVKDGSDAIRLITTTGMVRTLYRPSSVTYNIVNKDVFSSGGYALGNLTMDSSGNLYALTPGEVLKVTFY
jgi:hypothetical protein